MTFKERLIADHPYPEYVIDALTGQYCPSRFDYEKYNGCPCQNCGECWDREMEGENESA